MKLVTKEVLHWKKGHKFARRVYIVPQTTVELKVNQPKKNWSIQNFKVAFSLTVFSENEELVAGNGRQVVSLINLGIAEVSLWVISS